jgi:hypothetical protein
MFTRPGKPVRNCVNLPEIRGVWSLKTADLLHKFTAHRGGVWATERTFGGGWFHQDGWKMLMLCRKYCYNAEFHADFTVIVWLHGEFMQNLWSLIVDFRTYYGEQVVENTTSMKIGMYTIHGFTVNRKTSFFALIGWWMLMGRRLTKVSVMEEQVGEIINRIPKPAPLYSSICQSNIGIICSNHRNESYIPLVSSVLFRLSCDCFWALNCSCG